MKIDCPYIVEKEEDDDDEFNKCHYWAEIPHEIWSLACFVLPIQLSITTQFQSQTDDMGFVIM